VTSATRGHYLRAVGAVESSAVAGVAKAGRRGPWSWGRVVFLLLTGLCFYVFAPSLAEVFDAWDRLGDVHPVALLAVLASEGAAFVCWWGLIRIALRTKDWFAIANTQLAANAFNQITPGSGAPGTALQARMLADAGFDTTASATGIAVQSLLQAATVAAMPLLSIPFIAIAGVNVPRSLADGAWIGGALFVVIFAVLGLLLGSRRFTCRLGSLIQRIGNLVPRETPLDHIGEKLLHERDEIRETFGERWVAATAYSVGRWAFEYFVLLITLYAIGAKPEPWLVLFAFVFASVLRMLPFTPGGLGFVEAGLAGALALAGISAEASLLATLVFRLVSFWLPIPVGVVAAIVYRRRYPRGGRVSAPDADLP
jgi:uncharacterized protein (TIRG00374 family)